MSFNHTSIANLSDSDDESYKAGLARRRAKAETLLRQQEEKERLECQVHKEAKVAEQKRLEEEVRKKTGRGGDKEKRGRTPERSGTSIRGGSRRYRGTTTAQKLDEDFFAFESSFRRGHEFD